MGLSPRPSSVWSVSLSVRRSVLVHTRMSGLLGAALRTSVTHLAETFVYDVFESAEKQICGRPCAKSEGGIHIHTHTQKRRGESRVTNNKNVCARVAERAQLLVLLLPCRVPQVDVDVVVLVLLDGVEVVKHCRVVPAPRTREESWPSCSQQSAVRCSSGMQG